eukprot:4975284-Amphidinium_carterae.1
MASCFMSFDFLGCRFRKGWSCSVWSSLNVFVAHQLIAAILLISLEPCIPNYADLVPCCDVTIPNDVIAHNNCSSLALRLVCLPIENLTKISHRIDCAVVLPCRYRLYADFPYSAAVLELRDLARLFVDNLDDNVLSCRKGNT